MKARREEAPMENVIIYHNPSCGTSRNTLAMIRNAGIEPFIIEYLKSPPTRAKLEDLLNIMGRSPRDIIRKKEAAYKELGLDNLDLSEGDLIDALLNNPKLIERPIVVTSKGVRLCRPSEVVLEILPTPQLGEFRKENGEIVVDHLGRRTMTA